MDAHEVTLLDESGCRELEEMLVDRIYEFNANATDHSDGRLIGGRLRDDAGKLIGGFSGHTWGGCCVIDYLWVLESRRGKGLGRRMLQSAESEALRRTCVHVILATHSFQAPAFYERMGYLRIASVEDWPLGHSCGFYRKALVRVPRT